MKSLVRHLPEWLAALPGLAAGWFFTAHVVFPSARSTGEAPHPSRSIRNEKITSETGPDRRQATGKPPELRMSREKLAVLRNARTDLNLDFDSFDEDSAAQTAFVFEILRKVIDLTPAEESALRTELQRRADALRTYERTHLRDFSVKPGRISFKMPTGGDFRAELLTGIANAERSILGESRATMFEAITRTQSFTALRPDFDGEVRMSLEADGSQLHIEDGDGGMIMFFSDSPPDPLKQSLGKFEYLLDPSSRQLFFGKNPTD